ncbi:MAG: MoaD/ThiS family protein [Actinobacteria bacterium]|nr:MoaD/ThiS family protein [Actinomycetota bacterium]
MPIVTVRYWAAAKHAAGVAEEKISAQTLAEALTAVLAQRRDQAGSGPGGGAQALQAVLARSSFLVNGDPVGGRATAAVALPEAAVIEVLPPFAGG